MAEKAVTNRAKSFTKEFVTDCAIEFGGHKTLGRKLNLWPIQSQIVTNFVTESVVTFVIEFVTTSCLTLFFRKFLRWELGTDLQLYLQPNCYCEWFCGRWKSWNLWSRLSLSLFVTVFVTNVDNFARFVTIFVTYCGRVENNLWLFLWSIFFVKIRIMYLYSDYIPEFTKLQYIFAYNDNQTSWFHNNQIKSQHK